MQGLLCTSVALSIALIGEWVEDHNKIKVSIMLRVMNISALILTNFYSDFIQATNASSVIYATNISIGVFCTLIAINFFLVFRNVELIGEKSKLHIGIDLIEKDEISRFDEQILDHEKAKLSMMEESNMSDKRKPSEIPSKQPRIMVNNSEIPRYRKESVEDKEDMVTLIRPGKEDDDLFIINYEDTWHQLFFTKQTMGIIVTQSTLFAVWYANKVIMIEMASTEKSQHGLGLEPEDVKYCLFIGLIPALIFVVFFARLMISERKHHLVNMRYTNAIMIWLTAGILILKASQSVSMISNALLFF